jgi:predicted glycosyltransferase
MFVDSGARTGFPQDVSNALAIATDKAPTSKRPRTLPRAAAAGGGTGGRPRFLLYSHDGLGLGHVRRNLVIAAALVERAPGATVLLATSAEHADSLGVPDRVDLLRLPAVRKVDNGRYTPRRLAISGSDLTAVRAGVLAAAVESFRPSVLLVDKHPLGVGGELRTALGRLRELGGRAVLGLRDVLDDPATVRAEWTSARTRVVLEHYERVLVYGDEAVFDTLRRSALPAELAARSHYCGYVTMPVRGDAEAARTIRRFTPSRRSRPLVLATTGGGEDGRQLLEAFIEASAASDWEALAVAGPQLGPLEARALRRRADRAGVAMRTFVPELAGWFSAVDALVCMGGYNTLLEALVRGTPTVCVPRTRPRSEQLIRARALAGRGLLRVLVPERLDGRTLAGEVTGALARSRPAIAHAAQLALGFDGAVVAAESLLAEAAEGRARIAR